MPQAILSFSKSLENCLAIKFFASMIATNIDRHRLKEAFMTLCCIENLTKRDKNFRCRICKNEHSRLNSINTFRNTISHLSNAGIPFTIMGLLTFEYSRNGNVRIPTIIENYPKNIKDFSHQKVTNITCE